MLIYNFSETKFDEIRIEITGKCSEDWTSEIEVKNSNFYFHYRTKPDKNRGCCFIWESGESGDMYIIIIIIVMFIQRVNHLTESR